ncbi:MAG: gliding motility-associated ABC transporter ATP-binding subunit GldA [Bacteroidota bacterium]|nr:gliding motility-associated ABC transporter ATP-binding subunit GldA [Bacteroidota bacterium]
MSVIVQSLSRLYGTQRAVDDISFEIKSGEIVGFLGPNGAGKSTTMKMLTCYLAPTTGTASVCGKDIVEDSLEVRQRIGYLPEHNPLYTEMYVKEYLRFVAGVHHYKGNVGNRIKELVELTGLGVEQHKKIGMLSKGYRQRVGLAQALLHDPEVLILDEPTSGLDPNQIIDIRSLIRETGKAKTVIFSSHILQEVQAMCSRIIIINKGRIVADNSTEELMHRFTGKDYYRVEFKKPVTAGALKTIPGVEEVTQKERQWLLRTSGKNDIREAIFRWAVEHDNVIYEMMQESQSLENVFQRLTRDTSENIN